MINNKKIIAVLPAFNAAKTLKVTVDAIPKNIVDELKEDVNKDPNDIDKDEGFQEKEKSKEK
jgi:hypothetical protein